MLAAFAASVALCAADEAPSADSVSADKGAEAGAAEYSDCLTRVLATADDATTVGELRAGCKKRTASSSPGAFAVGPVDGLTAVDQRVAEEDEAMGRDYILTTYKPNYLLATYNHKVNQEPYEDALGEPNSLNNAEVKFQISIQAPIFRKPFGWESDLMVAYTATSWWQLGNEDSSNPFRETNYQPEIFLRNAEQHNVLGLKISGWTLGFNHESNGRSGDLSRSWNRATAGVVFDLNDLALITRAWYRIPESSEDDDNPDISHYTGYGDIRAVWVPSANTYSLMFRPAPEGSALELTWSRKISKNWRVYAQYWNGYAESLIDYDFRTQRIGIGFALSDYLER